MKSHPYESEITPFKQGEIASFDGEGSIDKGNWEEKGAKAFRQEILGRVRCIVARGT